MEDLKTRFLALVNLYGHQWNIISGILTKEGYKTPNGSKIWSNNCARKFYNRTLRTDKSPYDHRSILPGIGSVKPVKGYVDWWNRTRRPEGEEIDRKPILNGRRQKIGPRVNVNLLNLVKKQMKEDGILDQNNLSALVEFLLFRYAGSPESLMRPEEMQAETF
jgi:hypothetical protein